MHLGDELVKDQLFFRRELRERVCWFIHLRWVAASAALVGSGLVYYRWRMLPVATIGLIISFVFLYNTGFYLIGRRLEKSPAVQIRSYVIFTHIQIVCDLVALYLSIYFSGGIHSPLLPFLILPIALSGILLSRLSCYLYCFSAATVLGGILALQVVDLLPLQPVMFLTPLGFDGLEFLPALLSLVFFVAALFVAAFLVTTLKSSLRIKGRALLSVSKALDAGNEKLTALYKMVTEMGRCATLQTLMDLTTQCAAGIMGVKACSIEMLDDRHQKLTVASTYGFGEVYQDRQQGVEIAGSAIYRKIINGSVKVINRIDAEDRVQYPENIRQAGIASMICQPLVVGKTVWGMFGVYSDEPDYFSDDDVTFLLLMTDLTALFIDKLKRDLDKSWFLQKAAHQLRSPLNTVLSMLNLVKNQHLGPVTSKQAATLNRSAKRLQILGAVVADLLNLEIRRLDLQKIDLHPVLPGRILKDLVEPFQALAAEKQVGLTFDIENSLPAVLADESLVDELFTNLVSNAVKYTPTGGAVRVTLRREDSEQVRFQVTDTGIGVGADDIPRLFTEFFRSANARQFVENGTGLGLVVVKEILYFLNGTISVESTLGEGSCFTCRLPTTGKPFDQAAVRQE